MLVDVHKPRSNEAVSVYTDSLWNLERLVKGVLYKGDELGVFTLNQKDFYTKQGGKSVIAYYGKLTKIFQESDHRDKDVMKDLDDIFAYQKLAERLTRCIPFLLAWEDLTPRTSLWSGKMLYKSLERSNTTNNIKWGQGYLWSNSNGVSE